MSRAGTTRNRAIELLERSRAAAAPIEMVCFGTDHGWSFIADLQARTLAARAGELDAMLHCGPENDRLAVSANSVRFPLVLGTAPSTPASN